MPDDPAELGYIAGIIDGEGYIGVTGAMDKKSKNPSHAIRVVVTNTDPRMIQWFIDRFSGSVGRTTSQHKNWKPRLAWQIHGARAEQFLRAIRHLLIVKREQADIAIAMREIGQYRGGGSGRGGWEIPKDIVDMREHLKQRIHKLNERGVA